MKTASRYHGDLPDKYITRGDQGWAGPMEGQPDKSSQLWPDNTASFPPSSFHGYTGRSFECL